MKGQLTCEFKFATFSCQVRRQYQQDNEERDYSCQLQDALEPAVRMVSLNQYHTYTSVWEDLIVSIIQYTITWYMYQIDNFTEYMFFHCIFLIVFYFDVLFISG